MKLNSSSERTTPHFDHHPVPRAGITILSMAFLLSTAITRAQTWETVDDIYPGARAGGIAVDRAGNLFVAGSLKDASGVMHAIVMKSTDRGLSWDSEPSTPDVDEPVDTINVPNGAGSSFNGIVSAGIPDGAGSMQNLLLTAGTADGFRWIVRRSVDAGTTWTTLDYFTYSSATVSGSPVRPAIDTNGNIYVGGSATESVTTISKGKTVTTTVIHHLIRKYEAGVWRTVETTFPILRVVCHGTTVFALGASTNGSWQIRKSNDGGTSWTLVDDYRFAGNAATIAYDMTVDSQGNLFVVGAGNRVTISGGGRNATTLSERFWITRKGTAGGSQWTTSDVFDLGRPVVNLGGGIYYGAMNSANGVAVDSNDNVHVTGVSVGATENLQHWITRTLSAGTASWITTDNYNQFPGSSATQGTCIAADPFGNLFAAGFSSGNTGEHGWLMRRKVAP